MRRAGRKDWEDESDQTMYDFSYLKKSNLSGGLFQLSSEASQEMVEYHRTRKNLKKLEQSTTEKCASVEEKSTRKNKNVGRTRKKDVDQKESADVNAVAWMKGRLKTGKKKLDRGSLETLDTKEEESTETGKSNVEESESSEKGNVAASQEVECLEEDSESGDEMNFCPPPPAQGLSLMDMARRYGERVATFSHSSSHTTQTPPHFQIQHRSFSLQTADFLCGFMKAAAATGAPPVAPSPSVRQFCTNPDVSNALSELAGIGMCGSWEFPPDQPLRAALGSYVERVVAQMLPPGDVFSSRDVLLFSHSHLSPGEFEAFALVFRGIPDELLNLSSLVARLTLVALVVVFKSFTAQTH